MTGKNGRDKETHKIIELENIAKQEVSCAPRRARRCETKQDNATTSTEYDQERKERAGKPKNSRSTFRAAAAVFGASSIDRQVLPAQSVW